MADRTRVLIRRGLDAVETVLRGLLMLIVSVMVAIVGTQVALRYGFNISLDWADEVSRLAFVWMIFLGIPLAARGRAHVAIGMLERWLAPSWQSRLRKGLALLAAFVAAVVSGQAFVLILGQWDELLASLDWSAQWFVVPVATGMLLTAVFSLEQGFGPDRTADPAMSGPQGSAHAGSLAPGSGRR